MYSSVTLTEFLPLWSRALIATFVFHSLLTKYMKFARYFFKNDLIYLLSCLPAYLGICLYACIPRPVGLWFCVEFGHLCRIVEDGSPWPMLWFCLNPYTKKEMIDNLATFYFREFFVYISIIFLYCGFLWVGCVLNNVDIIPLWFGYTFFYFKKPSWDKLVRVLSIWGMFQIILASREWNIKNTHCITCWVRSVLITHNIWSVMNFE